LEEKTIGWQKTFADGRKNKKLLGYVFESYNESMYTILQKLNNIERALHRYDEMRHSIQSPYRAGAGFGIRYSHLTVLELDLVLIQPNFGTTVRNLVHSFCKLIWSGASGTKTVSLSVSDFKLDLSFHDGAQFRANASRKKHNGTLCTATINIDVPSKPGDDQLDTPDIPQVVAVTNQILDKIQELYS
jgi:hypothetical protein